MSQPVVDLLCELIAVPSVNPRLAPPGDPLAGEARVADWLARYCSAAGWRWGLQSVHAERDNFLALVPGERGDTLLWEVHQDTVSAQGMTVDPFHAAIRGGRVYGRGACDVKGSMAAMLAALIRAAAKPAANRPNLLLACTVNEECGFTGARALADIWRPTTDGASGAHDRQIIGDGGLTLEALRALRPNAALVAEPTELNVVVAHRGVARWQCEVQGRAAHSSRPEEGANAVYAMAHVVRLIEEYHRVELASRTADRLCGPSTACVTTIHGGAGPNTVPDHAVIDVDRRLAPHEQPQTAYDELVAYVRDRIELHGCRLEHQPPWMQSRGLAAGDNLAWAEQLAALVRSTGLSSELVGVPYGTNAASIAAAGIPAAVFGPGSIAQAHTADEWIAVEQLERAVEALVRVATEGFRPQASPSL